jgi:hypothetical protein
MSSATRQAAGVERKKAQIIGFCAIASTGAAALAFIGLGMVDLLIFADLGLIAEPPWTVEQLQKACDLTDPEGRRRGNRAPHGTITRWNAGCSCQQCRRFQSDDARARGRRKAQVRLPVEKRRQLLDCIYSGKPFRAALSDLGLTSNQVWGLAKTDEEWSGALEAALTAARRGDLKHGTNAAYVRGCVCKECPAASAPADG